MTLVLNRISVHNSDAQDFRKKRCRNEELADVIAYLKQTNPNCRFNTTARKELSWLVFNLMQEHPFKYAVGQSHTIRKTLKDKMTYGGLMKWDGGYHVKGHAAKVSVSTPSPLFFAVVNRHCQLKYGEGHIGYYDDPWTMRELADFNAFMAQHTFTHACGNIDHVHRFNYVRTSDGQGVIRQRLITDIHNKDKELRSTIEIDGGPTARFDVTATHPQLLLHKYAKQPMGFDPYDIDTDRENSKELRTAAKLATMMMLNTSSRKSAGAAFRKELAKPENRAILTAVISSYGSQSKILDMVYDRNPLLQRFFYTAPYTELMHMDGNIAWECVRRLADMGIPCLSVHDEFIVPHLHLDIALETYKQCWIKETEIEGLGIEPIIKIKG